MKYYLVIALICFFSIRLCGQTLKIDTLKRLIHSAKNDRQKLKALFNFCEEHESLDPDTLLRYAGKAQKLAIAQGNKLLNLQSDYYLTVGALRKGLTDSILSTCNEYIDQSAKIDPGEALWYKFSFLKTRILMTGRKYQAAMKVYYSLLKKSEVAGDTLKQMMCKMGVGYVHMEMGQHSSAITWFRNGIQTTNNQHLLNQLSILPVMYSNLAAEYINVNKPDSADYFIRKAIQMSRQKQQLSHLANALFIQADLFIQRKNNNSAEANMLEAIKIREQIGDPYYILSDMADLADFYASTHQPQKGLALAKQGIDIAFKTKTSSKLFLLYQALANNYKAAADYQNYSETLNVLLSLKDSIYQKNSATTLAELETRYQLQKKEAQITQQNLTLQNHNYIFWGSVIFSVLGAIIILLLFANYRRKQKIRFQALQDEEKRIALHAVADAEENERKRIAADLHDNLGAQLSFIKRNVNYIIDKPKGFAHGDETKYLGYVKDIAQNAMVDLRETIWVLNKNSIDIQEFGDKLNSYLSQQLLDNENIIWNFREDIRQEWKLSSGEVMHVFRIVQELISNIIKHAESSRIDVEFTSTGADNYQLTIADNGNGFDQGKEYKGHYGLENIQQRAGAIGAVLLIESDAVNGTKVTLTKSENDAYALFNPIAATNNFE